MLRFAMYRVHLSVLMLRPIPNWTSWSRLAGRQRETVQTLLTPHGQCTLDDGGAQVARGKPNGVAGCGADKTKEGVVVGGEPHAILVAESQVRRTAPNALDGLVCVKNNWNVFTVRCQWEPVTKCSPFLLDRELRARPRRKRGSRSCSMVGSWTNTPWATAWVSSHMGPLKPGFFVSRI